MKAAQILEYWMTKQDFVTLKVCVQHFSLPTFSPEQKLFYEKNRLVYQKLEKLQILDFDSFRAPSVKYRSNSKFNFLTALYYANFGSIRKLI